MKKKVEQLDVETSEIMEADEQAVDLSAEQQEEPSFEQRVDIVLDEQEEDLERQEAPHNVKTLTGLKKWAAMTALGMGSLLAVGCNAEKPVAENPDSGAQKIESTDGFKDNAHERVSQRAKIIKDSWKYNKKMKNYKPSAETKKFAKDMQESQIVQPYEGGQEVQKEQKVQKPGKDVKRGPSGKVMNQEDL